MLTCAMLTCLLLPEQLLAAGADARSFCISAGAAMPTSAYNHNRFYDAVGPMMGLLMGLCMVFPLSMLIRGVVEEKETKARETM